MKFFLLCLLFVPSVFSAPVETATYEDLSSLVPSFLLDQSGFSSDEEPIALSDNTFTMPMVPLLPLFQSGALGKKSYIGGVVDPKLLSTLSPGEKHLIKLKIRSMRTEEGYPFAPIEYGGSLYAIRSDYQIVYSNSTSVGLSIGMGGGGGSVIFGNQKSFGLSLEFGSSARIGKSTGLNVGGSLQKLIDDWMIGLAPDETDKVIRQAIAITPLLMNYVSSPALSLKDDSGNLLEPMTAKEEKDLGVSPEKASIETPPEEKHSPEWRSVKKNLSSRFKKLVEFVAKVRPMITPMKVLEHEEGNRFIQSICDRLATAYVVPDELWPRCRIAATLAPNAWAYPTGEIYITAGLLGILSDVDSVALVLGHEIGHVMGRHSHLRERTAKTVNYGASVVSSLVNLGATAFSLGGGFGLIGNVTFLSWFPQTLASSVSSSYLANKGLRLAMLSSSAGLMLQSREHEWQSDRIGQEAAYIAGADPDRMSQGWKQFVDFFDKNFPQKKSFGQKIMEGHPQSSDRLDSFEGRVSKLAGTLSEYNRVNAFKSELQEDYSLIHSRLKPYALAYGRELRKKFEAGEKTSTGSRRAHHFIQTMQGPHSLCISHALGAF